MNLHLSIIAFSIINYCSCNCKHCSVNSGNKDRTFLSADVILRVCEEFKNSGMLPEKSPIALSGGEVSLHPEINKIVKGIHDLGYKINMSTTGSNFTEEQIAEIAPLLNIISFSIDGEQEAHDTFRRTPNSFKKTIWAIEQFKKYGVANVAIQHTVYRENFNNIDRIVELADSLKVQHVRLIPLLPLGRAEENFSRSEFLDNNDKLKLLEKVIKYNGVYTDIDVTSIIELRSFLLKHPENVVGLNGLKSFEIDAYGGLFPHGAMPNMYKIGNVHEESINDLLNKFSNSNMLQRYLTLCDNLYKKYVVNSTDVAFCWEEEKQLEAERCSEEALINYV